jgi:LysM repeat protein
VVYVVQSGDTLGGNAVRYGVDLQALMNRNDIDDPRRLRSGQQLIIPIKRQ